MNKNIKPLKTIVVKNWSSGSQISFELSDEFQANKVAV